MTLGIEISRFRYRLKTLLCLTSITGIALGIFFWLGFYLTVVVLLAASIMSWLNGWRVASMGFKTCLVLSFLLFAVAFIDVVFIQSVYIHKYNMSLSQRAIGAGLIGAPEDTVENVLGRASYKTSGWNMTDMETGKPTDDAKFSTTYCYAPYPFIPYQRFEVHCANGKVTSIEMFED